MVDIFGNSTSGEKGDRGPPGSIGPSGVKGDIGPQGSIGSAGVKGDVGSQGPKGDVGPQGPSGFGGVIKWFPKMALEQILKNLKFCSFLIENITETGGDVTFDKDKRVNKWKSFNIFQNGERVEFVPINKGCTLIPISNEADSRTRYGLKFESDQQNMYKIVNADNIYLRDKIHNVVLTVTFLVGDVPSKNTGGEQFLISDYRWSPLHHTPLHNLRGLSIDNIDDKHFDLFLYGGTKKRLKIGSALKTSWYYTVQIKWGKESLTDAEITISPGFYSIFENDKYVIEQKLFHGEAVIDLVTPAFYIGVFNKTSTHSEIVQESKCFTGILSNLEIIKTSHPTIPKELLNFIVMSQNIYNDDWLSTSPLDPTGVRGKKGERGADAKDPIMESQYIDDKGSQPPSSKKLKLTNQKTST